MRLRVEHRASNSPYITRVWRSSGEHSVEEMLAIAYARWDLVFWEERGEMHATVVGPEPRPRPMPVPDSTESFGINFEFGTVLPQLPATRKINGNTDLPDVSRRRFHLAGASWDLPTYDNAEAFVAALVREGVLLRDRLVTDMHRGSSTDLSPRTVQRRFVAASGLTSGMARQIDRARNAAVLLEEGVSFAEVADELGYYDHAHLSRSVKRYIGRTPSQLRKGAHSPPLSLLYLT